MYTSRVNYNEIWNRKVPSSKFNYYLKQLISKELIEKDVDKKYTLTDKGMQYIAELNNKNFQKQTIPITCSFVLCVKEEDEKTKILLQRRKKQPYIGILNIPGGKVDFGESTYEAGIRELYEESKLTAHKMELKLIDEVRTYYESGETLNEEGCKNESKTKVSRKFAHIIAFTYLCTDFEGELEEENLEGEMLWIDIEDLEKEKQIFPNLIEIIPKILNSKQVLIQETNRYKDEEGNFVSYNINEK